MGECPRELDMEPIIAPIKASDTGAIVANLQDALLALLEQKKIKGARVEFFYRIEWMPFRLAGVVFPARIARNKRRRKLRL